MTPYPIRVGLVIPSDRTTLYDMAKAADFVELTMAKFKTWIERECGITFEWLFFSRVADKTAAEIAPIQDACGQGADGNQVWLQWWKVGPEWGNDATAPHFIARRHFGYVVNGGGFAGGGWMQLWRDPVTGARYQLIKSADGVTDILVQEATTIQYTGSWEGLELLDDHGDALLGDWGLHYAVTGNPDPCCVGYYGSGFCSPREEHAFGHEALHAFGCDPHHPYVGLGDALSAAQKSDIIAHNKQFLVPLAVPPTPPPPMPPNPPPGPSIVSLAVSPSKLKLHKGAQRFLTVTATYLDGTTVFATQVAAWSSSDPLVAIVEQGMVVARNLGIATIAALYGGLEARCSVTVTRWGRRT